MANKSRHPKIHYWFWDHSIMVDEKFKKDIDLIVENSDFDTMIMTERGGVNFWDLSYRPVFEEAVEYAHSKGIKIVLQLWPKGFSVPTKVDLEEATAIVTEHEGVVENGKLIIRSVGKSNRNPQLAPGIKSELLGAYAFDKTAEGLYKAGSLVNVTDKADIQYSEPESLSVVFDLKEYEGKTVYAMVAHYYRYADLFSDGIIRDYKNIMDSYSDIPFDGVVLDEFKNIFMTPYWNVTAFRERVYGKHFDKYFKEQTGKELIDTMFEMRYCPENDTSIRKAAINLYFDIYRHSTKRCEKAVAEYNLKVYGEDAFVGLHNTFHNELTNDEIWSTCCNWWEVPRKYAQTDEDITYPVRMGMACQCEEKIVYDMYYHKDENTFYEKSVRDARFGCRIHYHAMNDGFFGVDTGNKEFLAKIGKIEEKVTLLNMFDPVLPAMELLVVFGFPALCNWYPDESARGNMDINAKVRILPRVHDLWKNGYHNALAPSDALADGRITMKDGKFDYCGHKFDKMLYLYPQYSKKEVTSFIETAVKDGYDIKILGEITDDFNGKPYAFSFGAEYMLDETSDIAEAFNLKKNPIKEGCVLADGSVVISDYKSFMEDDFCTHKFEAEGHTCEVVFKGAMAIKLDGAGNVEKFVAGNLKSLAIDGKTVIEQSGEENYISL